MPFYSPDITADVGNGIFQKSRFSLTNKNHTHSDTGKLTQISQHKQIVISAQFTSIKHFSFVLVTSKM
jgi:hypothetical protein